MHVIYTKMSKDAFREDETIMSVEVEQGIEFIMEGAFFGCDNSLWYIRL